MRRRPGNRVFKKAANAIQAFFREVLALCRFCQHVIPGCQIMQFDPHLFEGFFGTRERGIEKHHENIFDGRPGSACVGRDPGVPAC